MSDVHVSLDSIMATIGWLLGLVLIGLDFWLDVALGFIGLAAIAAGCMFVIRGYLNRRRRRERDAFELGRATGGDGVRRLRD